MREKTASTRAEAEKRDSEASADAMQMRHSFLRQSVEAREQHDREQADAKRAREAGMRADAERKKAIGKEDRENRAREAAEAAEEQIQPQWQQSHDTSGRHMQYDGDATAAQPAIGESLMLDSQHLPKFVALPDGPSTYHLHA